jgi:hypothetical protein
LKNLQQKLRGGVTYVTDDDVAQAPGSGLSAVIRLLHDLLVGRDLHEEPGEADRKQKQILALTAAVGDAGLDGEALVRFGFAQEIAVSLAVALLEAALERSGPFEQWSKALGIESAFRIEPQSKPDGGTSITFSGGAVQALIRWVHHAPFADIVSWFPPSEAVQKRIAKGPEPAKDVRDEYRWIVDRLSGRPASKWHNRSIELEFLWRRGRRPANLPDPALVEIPVKTEEIAVEIADRALVKPSSGASPALADQVSTQAKRFLHAGRYTEAAALFEFMGEHSLLPTQQCLNNRGFCLIPCEPTTALHFLQAAAHGGYSPIAVNVYNQMCCRVALRDSSAARALSELYWSDQFEQDAIPATLWSRNGAEWVLTESADVRALIAELALENAVAEGWPDRVTRWQKRLEGLLENRHII